MNIETIRFIAAVLICTTTQHDIVFGKKQTSGRPDLTMYIDYRNNIVTCVAGTNTSGDALVLLAPLSDANVTQACKYINSTAIANKGCDFENYNCNHVKADGLKIIKSGLHNFLPITDERWNLFRQFRTIGDSRKPDYDGHAIHTKDFHISVSVRSTKDVQILLCDSDCSAKCYWILIDAFEENKVTALRKCVKGMPNEYPVNDPECSKLRQKKTLHEQLFKEMEWRHFTITRKKGKLLKLFELNDPIPLLEYTDSSPIDIDRLYFRGYNNAIAEWRIHEYNFLIITKPNRKLDIGQPIDGANNANELCLSLYVALCPQCKLNITIASDNGDNATTEIQGEKGIMVPWRNIRIRIKYNPESIYLLQAYASNDQNALNPFWAIDDIRGCHANEIRTISSYVSNVEKATIACQSLVYRHWIVKDTKTNNADERIQCLDPLLTGSSCNITCKSLFQNEEFCNNKKICRPASRSEQSCICSPGATGSTCSQACKKGRFGYNCEGICGQCTDGINCDKVTGNCKNGCKKGYVPPKCLLTMLPMLLLPPSVIRISHTSAMLQLANITVSGQKEPSTYQMEFKEDAKLGWQAFGHFKELELNSETEVTGLKPETSYLVRAVVYTATNESYKEDTIPTVEINTTCVERNIDIRPLSRSAHLLLQGNEESCNILDYHLIITDNETIVYEGQFGNTSIYVNTLKPYTSYIVMIENKKYTQYKYTQFNTLEDAPEKIENLHLEVASTDSLLLTWNPPVVTNGKIKQYIVSYQRTKYISCVEATTDYILYETVTPSANLLVTLQNLTPYSEYIVTIVAVTILNGTENTQYYSTNQTVEAGDEELPNEVTVDPDTTSTIVSWKLPLCSLIKGPLLYEVTIKCLKDAWCPIKSTIYSSVKSIARECQITKLIPWTHYVIEFKATRLNSIFVTTKSKSENFQTKKAAPPQVRNLTVFSKTESSISIRWMAPYPPHGELEFYQLALCYNGDNCSYVVIASKLCKLWDEYICFEIKQLHAKSNYHIFIKRKNKDISTFDNFSRTFTKTIQEKSEKPWNLTTEWKENKLVLYWNHPNITNGPLKRFDISLWQLDSEIIIEQKENVYYYHLYISEPLQHYRYSLNKSIPYSSSYIITIFGVNEYVGESETKIVNTPPETPELIADLSVNENGNTNTTITIIIPGIRLTTKSKTSFLYIIVSKAYTRHIEKRNTDEISNKEEILKFSGNQGNAWIAVELKPNESEVSFVIGDNSTFYSKRLDENLVNKPLEPASSYDITVVLMNQYKSQKCYKAYRLDAINKFTSGQNALYALLLLFLIVPVIVWCIYRKSTCKPNRPRASIEGLNPVQIDSKDEADSMMELTTKPYIQGGGSITAQSEVTSKVPRNRFKNERVSYHKYEEILYDATNSSISYGKINEQSYRAGESSIRYHHFNKYVHQTMKNDILKQQFELFVKGSTNSRHYGNLPRNNFKNQFNNITPYDFNRVVLQKVNNDVNSDYINASFIDGFQKERAYIATQNPRSTTFSDFWRMILQYDVNYIISISDTEQDQLDATFWPKINNVIQFGTMQITNINTHQYVHYTYRKLEISTDTVIKHIDQFQFTSWTNQGIPLHPQSLVSFIKTITSLPNRDAPVVVHCNTGIGRTGCFILIDLCIQMAKETGTINVVKLLHRLREQRINMVDNFVLYKVTHLILTEYFDANCACLPCNSDLLSTIQTIRTENYMKLQYLNLSLIAWRDEFLTATKIPECEPHNFYKNRIEHILPGENAIKLSLCPKDDQFSDYINAVPVGGLKSDNKFIVTQFPLPETVNDFWRMVYEKTIRTIIMLNTIPIDDKTCIDFVPNNADTHTFANFCIKLKHIGTYNHFDDIEFRLKYKNEQGDTTIRTIHLIKLKMWPADLELPNDEKSIIKAWEMMQKFSMNDNSPMIVTCLDGTTASGIFVAASLILEKMTMVQECDVQLAIRVVRKNRKQFITSLVQYDFLYQLAATYHKMTEIYSHYETPIICNRKSDI